MYSENLRFVFDKHTDNLPITRTLIDSGLPCLTSPGFNIPEENFSKIDIELDMYNECTSQSIRDDRYKKLNITTTEYEMQDYYGILNKLALLP